MSQPCKRGAQVERPGELDPSLNEFWSENPWDITSQGHNLSAFERNRTWISREGKAFLDVSFLSGADSDGDGRAVVAGDFRNIGKMDLLVRQVSGGPIHLYENNLPRRHYLTLSLRGTQSNRLGIGARVTLESGGRTIVRELFPADGFRSQRASRLHFGLADDSKIDRLTIRWPSGLEQVATGLRGDRHVIVTEGRPEGEAVETVNCGQTILP